MMSRDRAFQILTLAVCALCFSGVQGFGQEAGPPETVMVTFHAKAGSEAELERVIAAHWQAASKLKLVEGAPHLTLRGSENGGKTYFVEIFTWRSAAAPDSAPAEIRGIWDQMNRLVEGRDGHPGLEFIPAAVVSR